MKTRELATQLRDVVRFLESRPEFELDGSTCTTTYGGKFQTSMFFYNKENFVEASKCFGNAVKSVSEGEYAEFILTSTAAPVALSISRDAVCTKKVLYDCEPLFTPEEMEAL